jgi:glycerol-3-phosphate dehydrogenase (NAD(P)+)
MKNIAIIGTGAFGLALATMFNENKNNITMWSKFENEINNLKNTNTFQNYKLPNNINYTTNIEQCIKNSDLIVIAIPVAFIKDTIKELKKYYQNTPILIVSKGIEQNSNLFAIDIVKNEIKTKDIGVISGATFAIDMIKKQPMGLTLATKSNKLQKLVMNTLKNKYLNIQYTKDIIGVELCGSIKNVIAIASGIIDGLGYGESTKYLLITKAIYQIQNFIILFKGNKNTILTYAGIDDIFMTCSSNQSRNYTLGSLIGSNTNKDKIEQYKKETTIEGLYTTKSIYDLFKSKNIDNELITIIYSILYENTDPNKLIQYLENN